MTAVVVLYLAGAAALAVSWRADKRRFGGGPSDADLLQMLSVVLWAAMVAALAVA